MKMSGLAAVALVALLMLLWSSYTFGPVSKRKAAPAEVEGDGGAIGSALKQRDSLLLEEVTRLRMENEKLQKQAPAADEDGELERLRAENAELKLKGKAGSSDADRIAQQPEWSMARKESQAWNKFLETAPEDTPTMRELRTLLDKTANERKEVMVGLANDVMMCSNPKTCWWNGGNILKTFVEVKQKLNVKNYVVIALDDATADFCKKFGASSGVPVPHLRMEIPVPKAQQGSRGANMISTLKYNLLKQMFLMGFSVLIVDLDVAFVQDPFKHLHRDSDLEGSTDGFTAGWSYGQIGSISDKSMGWGGGGLYTQIFTLNVGCVFFQPTPRNQALVTSVSEELARRPAWDQEVFNRILWTASHGDKRNSQVSIRVMDHDLWVNSKTFFKSERFRFLPGATAKGPKPVMVHTNYHPDKHKRMLCVVERYHHGKIDACDHFPGGSEPGT